MEMTNTTQEELLPLEEFEILMRQCGYEFGDDALACAYEGYRVAMTHRTPPAEQPVQQFGAHKEPFDFLLREAVQILARCVEAHVGNAEHNRPEFWQSVTDHIQTYLPDFSVKPAAEGMTDETLLRRVLPWLQWSLDSPGPLWELDALKHAVEAHLASKRQPANQGAEPCNYPDCKCPTETPCLQGNATGSGEMPELPEPRFTKRFIESYFGKGESEAYTRDQMQAYARQAIAKCGDRRDAERLNFIERNFNHVLRYHKKQWSLEPFTNYEFPSFKTLREAVDAAIAKEQK